MSAMDTSRMSIGMRAVMEMVEAARDQSEVRGFLAQLFRGEVRTDLIRPYPVQSQEDVACGADFLSRMDSFLRDHVDPDEMDRTGEIPTEVLDGFRSMGALGMKIPKEYGGMGLSQANYARVAQMLGSYDGGLTALLSAHTSIGAGQPIRMFGTDEQKTRFLPRIAAGQYTAFALTEPGAGSDPAKVQMTGTPTEDGNGYLLNGQKLWCTNALIADLLVVMAVVPVTKDGKTKRAITAFIVELPNPGVSMRRCRFLGLHTLQNAFITFRNVYVPKENIVGKVGQGLKIALTTLNTGRLTIPAACIGASKVCLQKLKKWANCREQMGATIGKHGLIAEMITDMAADIFAMEAIVDYTNQLVDSGKADVRLEAAACKLFVTELTKKHTLTALQGKGGRGYETNQSLTGRGEAGESVEREVRDNLINTIFEGSSQVMVFMITRDALAWHLNVAGPLTNSQIPLKDRLKLLWPAARIYLPWYVSLWNPFTPRCRDVVPAGLRKHYRFVVREGRRFARSLFHAMAVYRNGMVDRQLLLSRYIDIALLLFAIEASCSRAERLIRGETDAAAGNRIFQLADYYCRRAELKIAELFRAVTQNVDDENYAVAQTVLNSDIPVLRQGIIVPVAPCGSLGTRAA